MPFPSEYSYLARGSELRRSLTKAEGLELTSPSQGKLSVGVRRAEVRLEPDGAIRVELDTPSPDNLWEALEWNARLHGNVRFAIGPSEAKLVADTQVDGESHLSESFRQIRQGMLRASLRNEEPEPYTTLGTTATPVSTERVEQVITRVAPNSESLARHEHGWELRVRQSGELIPLQLAIDQHDLTVRHTLPLPVTGLGDRGPSQAVAHHAAGLNTILRHARLALYRGRLIAEARLHPQVITEYWVRHAAHAVASAAHRAWPSLRVLLHQPSIRQLYDSYFHTSAITRNSKTSDLFSLEPGDIP